MTVCECVVLISPQGWVVASDSITEERFVVRGLRPDTTYLFLVRSRNSHGISLPSHVSASIRTKGRQPTLARLIIILCYIKEKMSK